MCLGSWGLEMTVLTVPAVPLVAGNNGLLFAFSKVDTQVSFSFLRLTSILLISPARGQKFHEHVKGQSWSTKVEQRKKPLEKT